MPYRINIGDLKLDNSIWPRHALDEEAIERYRDCLDELPFTHCLEIYPLRK